MPTLVTQGVEATIMPFDQTSLDECTVDQLRQRAKKVGLRGIWDMTKEQLLEAVAREEAEDAA